MINKSQHNHEETRDSLEGNEQLMLSLLEWNEELVTQWNIFEMALEKKSLGQALNQKERNVCKWYESLGKWYPGTSKNERNFEYRDIRDYHIIEEIESQEYHWLKKAIEVMLKDILSLHFKKHIWEFAKVFLSSDYDDIKSWIDAIVAIEKWGQTHYTWIDFFVSSKTGKFREKGKRKKTNPKEFSHHMWEYIEMERIVKDFNPRVVGLVFNYYLKQIIRWNDPSNGIDRIYELAKEHIGSRVWREVIRTQNSLNNVIHQVAA